MQNNPHDSTPCNNDDTHDSTPCNKDGYSSPRNEDGCSTPCNDDGYSTPSNKDGYEFVMDYSSEFATDEIFTSKESLIQWARDIGRKNGFVICVKRSDMTGKQGRKPTVTIGCERSGKYKSRLTSSSEGSSIKTRKYGTKKCDCPFMLKGRKLSTYDDGWVLQVACGLHNHPATEQLVGHSYAGRLTKDESELLVEMSKSLAKPKEILNTLKERDALNMSTMRNIYNALHKHRVVERAGRSPLQCLISKLSEHGYVEWHRSCDDGDTIKDLFWAHPTSIDLLHAFPYVLIMECICKTNIYNCPLLEIIGVTSTDMTFSVAFAYIEAEKEDNYVWVLNKLKSLMDEFTLPDVIITDGDLALMSAIEMTFPTVDHMLCRGHIEHDISAKCKEFMTEEVLENFLCSWRVLLLSSTETEYLQYLSNLQMDFNAYPQAIEYVTSTWLDKYKEQFVGFWTNNIMHFGNVTIHRAESAHAKLKRMLGSNQGSFESNWRNMHELLELQHTDIKSSFEKSFNVIQQNFRPAEFKELRGFISLFALKLVFAESRKANVPEVDSLSCGCTLRRTHGLPCLHEIAEYKALNRPIALACVHPHWRKLDLLPPIQNLEVQLIHEVELFTKRYHDRDDLGRMQLLKKLKDITYQTPYITYPDASAESAESGHDSDVLRDMVVV